MWRNLGFILSFFFFPFFHSQSSFSLRINFSKMWRNLDFLLYCYSFYILFHSQSPFSLHINCSKMWRNLDFHFSIVISFIYFFHSKSPFSLHINISKIWRNLTLSHDRSSTLYTSPYPDFLLICLTPLFNPDKSPPIIHYLHSQSYIHLGFMMRMKIKRSIRGLWRSL